VLGSRAHGGEAAERRERGKDWRRKCKGCGEH
jgi:hypothetical protein